MSAFNTAGDNLLQINTAPPTQQHHQELGHTPSDITSPASIWSAPAETSSPSAALNVLQIDVIEARSLSVKRKNDTCHAFVKLQLGSYSSRTRVEKGSSSTNVNWDQRVTIPFKHPNTTVKDLHITVYDQDRLFKDELGQFVVPGHTITALRTRQEQDLENPTSPQHHSQWYDLTNKYGMHGGSLGQVRIGLMWSSQTHSKVGKRNRLLSRIGIRTRQTAENISVRDSVDEGHESDESEEDENTFGDEKVVEADESEDEEDREAAERAEKEELLAAARNRKIKPGDWRVVFHVIELRELNPEDLQGTSDPVCQITLSTTGMKPIKRSSGIKKAVRSCVFDESFFFDLKAVDKDQLEAAELRFAVFDADSFSRNELIGAYTFDVLSVYYSKNSCLQGVWVALIDDKNPADKGLQGYARVTVTVLGPGDSLKEETVAEEGPNETGTSTISEGDMSNVLMPPNIKQELYFLRVQVYIATDLPNLDRGVMTQGGIDAFIKGEFNGSRLRTRVVTCKARRSDKTLKAVFNEELLFPVFLQNGHTLAKSIKIAVKDYDRVGANDLVSTLNLNFQDVLKRTLRFPKMMVPPRWYPLYGAPVYNDANLVTGMDSSVCSEMNTHPSSASAYRGSVLIGLRCTKFADGSSEAPHKMMIRSISRSRLPRTTCFVLRFWALAGSELSKPQRKLGAARLGSVPLVAWVCIGPHKIASKAQPCHKGVVDWSEGMDPLAIEMPVELYERWNSELVQVRVTEYDRLRDEYFVLKHQVPKSLLHSKDALTDETISQLEPGPLLSLIQLERRVERVKSEILALLEHAQVPDIFLYVGPKGKRISAYARFPAGSLLLERFREPAKWIALQEEKATNLLSDDEFPGSILARVAFGPEEIARDEMDLWDTSVIQQVSTNTLYDVHVYLYKGSDIAAADSNGLSDPYCIVKLQGETRKSHRKDNTCDPEFYQVIDFEGVKLPNATFAPYVTINLFDYDRFDRDDRLGSIRVPLAEVQPKTEADGSVVPGDMAYVTNVVPKWYPVTLDGDTHGLKCGSLLVGVQVLERSASQPAHKFPDNIAPEGINASVELLVLGLRQMQSYNGLPVQFPLVEAHMGEANASKIRKTSRSKKPDGSNANFGERLVIPFKMPNDPVFMPKLHIRVVDHRFGGLLEPVVATTAIDLVNKLHALSEQHNKPGLSSAQSFRPQSLIRQGHPGRRQSYTGEGDNHVAIEEQIQNSEVLNRSPFIDDPTDAEQWQSDPTITEILGDDEMTVLTDDLYDEGDDETDPLVADEEVVASKIAQERKRMDSGGDLRDQLSIPIQIKSPESTVSRKRSSLLTSQSKTSYSKINGTQTSSRFQGKNLPSNDQDEVVINVNDNNTEYLSDESSDSEIVEFLDNFKPWPKHDPFPMPEWMNGRETVPTELEHKLGSPPFETYKLFRGQKFGRGSFFGRKRKSNYRKVGSIKCVVNIIIPGKTKSPISDDFLAKLMLPRPVAIRINVLKGFNFQPLDVGGGKSDPYLKLQLGKQKISDRKRYIENAVDPEFFRRYDMQTTLPGASQLVIKAMDYDTFTSDDFIGETLIDLEDRWFSDQWQQFNGLEETCASDLVLSRGVEQPPLYRRKPVELRSLWTPTSLCEQGQLELWIDMMDQLTTIKYPPVDIAPPENLEYELRVVVWKTQDIPSFDDLTGQNDLFVKCIFGDKSKSTDTHWRCKKGNGSFNYRIKFPVKLPLSSLQARLTIQVWDKDVLKWNDCIAEAIVDLDKHMKAVFVQHLERHQVYDDNRSRERRQVKEIEQSTIAVNHQPQPAQTSSDDIANTGEIEMTTLASTDHSRTTVGETTPTVSFAEQLVQPGVEESQTSPGGVSPSTTTKRGKSEQGSKKKRKKKKPTVKRDESKDAVNELVHTYIPWAADLVTNGIPPNSKEISLYKSGKPMGKVYISVELVRVDVAQTKFVNGDGRNAPNEFPVLPKPTGRLKLSKFWNPFYVLEECLGPALCRRFVVGCCCIIMVPVVIFVLPNVTPAIDMLESLPSPFGDLVVGLLTSLVVLSCCYCLLYHKFKEEMARCCGGCCKKRNSSDVLEGYEPMQPSA